MMDELFEVFVFALVTLGGLYLLSLAARESYAALEARRTYEAVRAEHEAFRRTAGFSISNAFTCRAKEEKH